MNIVYTFEIINYFTSFDAENNITYVSKIDWRYHGTNENNITSYVDGSNYYTEQPPYTSTTESDLVNMVANSNDIGNIQNKIKIKIYNIVYPRTYKWIIYSLNVIPSFEGYNNFVTIINWRYNATSDSGITANIEGQTTFNKVCDSFIDYNNLTENEVINWIESTEDIASLKEKLDSAINEKINPQIVSLPIPW